MRVAVLHHTKDYEKEKWFINYLHYCLFIPSHIFSVPIICSPLSLPRLNFSLTWGKFNFVTLHVILFTCLQFVVFQVYLFEVGW